MADLTLRVLTNPGDVTKNAPLTNAELDQNFINLDNGKAEASALAAYAPLASPAFTGVPTAPNPIPANNNNTTIATTNFVQTAVAAKVTGPASATDSAVALFDSTTGKLIKDSATTLPGSPLVGTTTTQTLINKIIDLANNTLTGTIAQFNTALVGADFATIAETETLSNKTLDAATNILTGLQTGLSIGGNAATATNATSRGDLWGIQGDSTSGHAAIDWVKFWIDNANNYADDCFACGTSGCCNFSEAFCASTTKFHDIARNQRLSSSYNVDIALAVVRGAVRMLYSLKTALLA